MARLAVTEPTCAVRTIGWLVHVTRHGFKEATTDPVRIRAWWARHPACNVAIATGTPGPDVLDVDQRGEAGNGFAAFNRLHREGLWGFITWLQG
jgi:hypothetical protein